MKTKKAFRFFLLFASLLIVIFPIQVEAKEVLIRQEAKNINNDLIGAITLYDDKTITYEYLYRVNDISITICKKNNCDGIEPQIYPNQTYIDGEIKEFSIEEYLVMEEETVVYVITAQGSFKPSNEASFGSQVTLTYEVTVSPDQESGEDKELNESFQKVIDVCNKWVIPIIYLALAITIVVKLILLAIDLIKYSDNADLRKEKIRGFIYVFIAVLVGVTLNTIAGALTGLFH